MKNNNLWKAIAIVGVWLSVSIMAFFIHGGVVLIAIFAVLTTEEILNS